MKNTIQTTYTDSEFRDLLREEIKKALTEINAVTINSEEGYLSAQDAADFLKLGKNTIYNLINANKIPYHKKQGSRRVLFKKSELIEWLKEDQK